MQATAILPQDLPNWLEVLLLAWLAFLAVPVWGIHQSLKRLLAGLADIENTLGRLAKAVEFFERRP